MPELQRKKCLPCEGGVPPMPLGMARAMLRDVPGWSLVEKPAPALTQELVMKDFMEAVRFIGEIAAVADMEDHHPDLHLTGYRKLRIEITTHAIQGLSENDFILAAKIDQLPRELKA